MSQRRSTKSSKNPENLTRPRVIQSTLRPAVNDVLIVVMVAVNSVKLHTVLVIYAANIKMAQFN